MIIRDLKNQRGLRNAAAAIVIALALTGCQSELYSNLPERDVKEMVLVLKRAGIDATTTAGEDGRFSISVERSQLSSAIGELSRNGLPRRQYGSLGDIFAGDKLVSTPFEERARFMYALNEELADSITRIAGITSARVHIMLPETSPFTESKAKPRAAVFIYKSSDETLADLVPVVKNLIVNSMDGLEYENVEVAVFDAALADTSNSHFGASLSGLAGSEAMIGILAGGLWFALRQLARLRREGDSGSAGKAGVLSQADGREIRVRT